MKYKIEYYEEEVHEYSEEVEANSLEHAIKLFQQNLMNNYYKPYSSEVGHSEIEDVEVVEDGD